MTEQELRTLAEKIARCLFTNGAREQATRLVLTDDGPPIRDLGGWSRVAVIEQIYDVLRRELA